MNNHFTAHPRSQGFTYWQHLFAAFRLGFKAILAGLAALVHGIFPFLFPTTLSSTVAKLHQEFSDRAQHKKAA